MIYQRNMCYLFRNLYNKQIQRNINNYLRLACNYTNTNNHLLSIAQQSYKPLVINSLTNNNNKSTLIVTRYYSDKVCETAAITNAEKLKKAVKEYGSTVIVFHIGISLVSLGIFYGLVSSGVDLTVIFDKLGFSDEKINKLAGNTGTFVIAYAVHKVFAPVRIGITLTATPFIVRHLRNIGWLKK